MPSPTEPNPTEAPLPRRDWLLIPMLSVLTICFIALSTELLAQWMFPSAKPNMRDCWVTNDRSTGVRGIPNSDCWSGLNDRPPVEFKFNSCGHDAGMECGTKQPGTYRIVMVGSSFAMGLGVAREKTFGALLPAELSGKTSRKVELYNESDVWEVPHVIDMRFDEALKAKPDMILWAVTSWDIAQVSLVLPEDLAPLPDEKHAAPSGESAGIATGGWRRLRALLNVESIHDAIRDRTHQARSLILLRHFLWKSQSLYLRDSLKGPLLAYLLATPNEQWQTNLRTFGGYAADIESKTKAAGVPLVVVLLPARPHAAMISMGQWPSNLNPYAMDDELRSIVAAHGETYIDILPDFRDIPDPEQYYFPVDGHPNAEGHAILSRLLARQLTGGAVPALTIAPQTQAVRKTGT